METNPYEYDRSVAWIPQQNQGYAGRNNSQSMQQRLPARQAQAPAPEVVGAAQRPKLPKPMPKARALELAHTFKRWLVVASFVGFGTLSGLAAFHQVGTTTSASASSQTSQTTSSSSSSNSFLHQREEDHDGSDDSDDSAGSSSSNNSTGTNSSSSSTSTGNSTGTSSSSTSSQPVSGTRTS